MAKTTNTNADDAFTRDHSNTAKHLTPMSWRWLIRATMWARNPPSAKKVKLVLGLVAACIAIAMIERYVGWPDWATAERIPRLPR